MRIVLDTNVLVSGSLWSGDSHILLRKAEAQEFILLVSEDIIKEFLGVLNYKEIRQKIADKNLTPQPTIEQIFSFSEFVTIKKRLNVITEDSSDDRILECAQSGRADLIVSQDKHLLKLGEFGGIKIVKPTEALERISK
jgi:uncharacterized protein